MDMEAPSDRLLFKPMSKLRPCHYEFACSSIQAHTHWEKAEGDDAWFIWELSCYTAGNKTFEGCVFSLFYKERERERENFYPRKLM